MTVTVTVTGTSQDRRKRNTDTHTETNKDYVHGTWYRGGSSSGAESVKGFLIFILATHPEGLLNMNNQSQLSFTAPSAAPGGRRGSGLACVSASRHTFCKGPRLRKINPPTHRTHRTHRTHPASQRKPSRGHWYQRPRTWKFKSTRRIWAPNPSLYMALFAMILFTMMY